MRQGSKRIGGVLPWIGRVVATELPHSGSQLPRLLLHLGRGYQQGVVRQPAHVLGIDKLLDAEREGNQSFLFPLRERGYFDPAARTKGLSPVTPRCSAEVA